MKKSNSTIKLISKYMIIITSYLALSVSCVNAETTYFFDDFENGLDQLDTAGDSWQLTDRFYHSPSYCASDSPEGSYPKHANSTMTMNLQCRIDLSGSTHPILMFWHKIGVYNGDHGYVEISEDYGFNWTVLTSFTNQWRSTWSREIIDLSAYKSSTILIRFRLRDDGGNTGWPNYNPTVTWGWDIDDVEVRELDDITIPFPFFDDFESGYENWRFGGWQLTESFYRSPILCMTDSNVANYPKHACSDLILVHPIDLSTSVWPVLDFWHKIGVCNGDYGRIEVSQDCGLSWQSLDPNHPELGTFTNLWYANWTREIFDLSAYKSTPILIRFRLRDDGGNTGWPNYNPTVSWGWDIDDVMIRELIPDPRPLNVQIADIDTLNCPEIQATVIVTDISDEAVVDLNASNFYVYENGILQTPITVELSTSSVYASLALDYSGSMEPAALEALEIAATGFVEELMLPGDHGEIIKFANGIEIMQEYTDDKTSLINAINLSDNLDPNATSLYDAIYQAISDTAEQPGSKAVVAMSDGRDTNSQKSATAVIDHAVSNGVPVFTIGLGDEIDEDVLIAIATQTGGIYYYAPTPEDLATIYEKIAGTLNTQYLVTYDTITCEPNSSGDVEHELNIEVYQGAAYGQGTRRFRCPSQCDPNAVLGVSMEGN